MFVRMLLEAEGKHLALKGALRSFAVLVCDKVRQTGYLIREYLDDRVYLYGCGQTWTRGYKYYWTTKNILKHIFTILST